MLPRNDTFGIASRLNMHKDPIVEAVRRIRAMHVAQFDYDVVALCRDLRKQEKASGRAVVSLPPKSPSSVLRKLMARQKAISGSGPVS